MSTKTFSQIRLEQAINLIIDDDTPIREISIRCPYCGDSIKNPNSTHLGIRFGHPSIYHCFKCNVSGIVSTRFLKDMDIDKAIIKKYVKWAKLHRYDPEPRIREVSFNNNKEIYDFPLYNTSNQYKYLSERFGVEFTEADLKRYRVILNPSHFVNRLKSQGKEIKTKVRLNNYIGFLTQDGNQAVFRAIYPNIEPRYYNMAIEETEYRKLYVLDTEVDIKAESFNFILTEGVFDLIGVYEKFFKGSNANNNLFVAALGKSFDEPINRLIRSGFLNFNIMLYADSSEDINIEFLNDIFKNDYIEEILLVNNIHEGEKDFGVNLANITEKETVINRRVLKQMNIEYNKKKE